MATVVWAWLVEFLPRLSGALLLLVLGYIAARYASKLVRRLVGRSAQLDQTLAPVLTAVIRYAIVLVVLIAVLGQLGMQTTSLLAALGAAGLAIGLALQGTLSNIAAGIMLLWLRPFSVGDYIEAGGVAGTVDELGLFASRLRTWDGIFKFVPNSALWNTILTNYTRNPTRLILIEFGIAYGDDVATGRRVLKEVAESHPQVLKDPPVQVVPLSLADSAVILQVRAWAPSTTFWDTRWDLTEAGKAAIEAAGLTIPFPQRVVTIANAGAPPEIQQASKQG